MKTTCYCIYNLLQRMYILQSSIINTLYMSVYLNQSLYVFFTKHLRFVWQIIPGHLKQVLDFLCQSKSTPRLADTKIQGWSSLIAFSKAFYNYYNKKPYQ